MAGKILVSRFTLVRVIYLLLVSAPVSLLAINVTSLLSSFPDLSSFSDLLSSTGVAAELSGRTSLTILAVPNSHIGASVDLTRRLSPSSLADLIRYHVLLQFISDHDLRRISPSGSLVTTLFQTTGRAGPNSGSVNITRDPTTNAVTVHSPPSSNATVLSVLKTLPYNVTIWAVDSLLVPLGFDLMASESRPPLGLNITKTLIDGHDFNVAAAMLAASGVVSDFENDERGAGITLFVPTDVAFSDLPGDVRLQSLPADKKSVVLKFHVLHSYYPLGSLESIVNPVQPTLATEEMGAGSYTLNISRVNGLVAIDTGIVQAFVTQTVFDQNPVAIFGVSKVLLPREIFGSDPSVIAGRPATNAVASSAPPPEIPPPPEISPSRLSAPPGMREYLRSGGQIPGGEGIVLVACIGLYLLL
ncbi:PREDICTED: fasciclin-like arabinogalactan protein 4 [Tarenaya hassleriana]|uniref:fasciclin-like arabinogalactan protein 4 n=1 Tax=Tarenaya hassleriana TaxID=28532 RepID=UPI00053C84D3|nr:PREDICTED: fasciclin-like arabinogalactan protein 4 [Tarenaya hassleriana]